MALTQATFKPSTILRYPRLDTILMVEEAIQKAKEYPTKAELFRKLPRKTMYQTFNLILDYLQYSGKIAITKNGSIVWIWNPKLVEKYINKPELQWRQ